MFECRIVLYSLADPVIWRVRPCSGVASYRHWSGGPFCPARIHAVLHSSAPLSGSVQSFPHRCDGSCVLFAGALIRLLLFLIRKECWILSCAFSVSVVVGYAELVDFFMLNHPAFWIQIISGCGVWSFLLIAGISSLVFPQECVLRDPGVSLSLILASG